MLTYTDSSRSPGWNLCGENGGGTSVSSHCRHYTPRGPVSIMSMEDYRMCDSCRHQTDGASCTLAENRSPQYF